ncbi:methyltransferase [Candidatus Viridilinea mediisalina]|nr:methyltransferase [Candidatus Viridilinea mediisalina]
MSYAYRRELLDLLRGYRSAQVLIVCTELGVFEALAAGPANAQELGAQLKQRPEVLERLLNAAVALGLLELQHERRYANGPVAAACLSGTGPFFIGNLVRREANFYERWGQLGPTVRGEVAAGGTYVTDRAPDPTWVRRFELGLYDVARTSAPLVAELLAPLMPSNVAPRVLDIGGGHGAYSMALAQRYPTLTATIFELPPVIPVAQELVAASGLTERVALQSGDFKQDHLGTGYHLALLFGILTHQTTDEAVALLTKVHAALEPGGAVVIHNFLLNSDRVGPLDATLFDLHMLLANKTGAAYTSDELAAWLEAAGFTKPETLMLNEPEPLRLLVARKRS